MVYNAKNFQNDARQLNIMYKESRENEVAHSLLSECIKIISRTEVSCMLCNEGTGSLNVPNCKCEKQRLQRIYSINKI